ncbi:MAG: BtpA/SgcQ family protein [Planctomycetota bacterium]|nr:BtpA/SgcQ family protein [Planctomycetota bacterium]MCB9824734.1 BtpA/SgcQ family protein [Planctomycetota bacterium]MCB9899855.1 BtpA/SgcQ family protein [Planctomycetota bacterium]
MARTAWDRRPLLLGMVHLLPLPGSPRHRPERGLAGARWLDQAVRDATLLAEAGFDGVIVENLGDAPFFGDDVPDVTVAALGVAAHAVRRTLPRGALLGVNVLRNDARAALAIAAVADADLVRVNVLTGAVVTDQGLLQGHGAEVLRERRCLAPQVRVLADVRVKHAAPLAERPLADEVADLVERGGADALVVSGSRTGAPVDLERLKAVAAAASGRPVLVGSGATPATVRDLLAHADGVIVGTALKRRHRLDADRARAFVEAARASS